MLKKKKNIDEEIKEKLNYLGLDLENIPDKLKKVKTLEYKVPKIYDEKKYRQYRYVNVSDIQILLSPTNRLTDLSEKYAKAEPLREYLDGDNEKNILKFTTFLSMIENMNIEEIETISEEQEKLSKNIPFKVKFQGNYLWQIYYSENTNQYFMIVPTEDTDYSAFFYLLKRQIKNVRAEKIFVPISSVRYSSEFFKKSEFEDIENYLWLFTKDWPSIYEVYDRRNELSIHIIGETNVYEKMKSTYKTILTSKKEAIDFYKLLKALFILQTDLPNYYNFITKIDDEGSIEFYFENTKIEYNNIIEFIREQYKEGLKRKKEVRKKIRIYNKRIQQLKNIVAMQEIEYLSKEKQISTFLECKKSFFGKFKYYFKYSKKTSKKLSVNKQETENVEIQKDDISIDSNRERRKIPIKNVYTLEELIQNYKELEQIEQEMKNLLMDLNALKLKTKNMERKIENATNYIEEIDKHKKSIFEFWKYSNKDEMDALPEGEQEEVNVIKKIEKVFDYEQDIEEFGEKLDKIQRKNLNIDDTDSVYIATTELLNILNKLKNENITEEELEISLKKLRAESKKQNTINEEDYDIFGNISEDEIKTNKINGKPHKEMPKDKFNILDMAKNGKKINMYRIALQMTVLNLLKALEKILLPENVPVYKATIEQRLNDKNLTIFNINPENEIKEIVSNQINTFNIFKINLKEGTKAIGFTNIIFYDNENKTLPLGMDLSTKIILDISRIHLKLVKKTSFKILEFVENDDFSDIYIKKVNAFEYDIVDISELENVKEYEEEIDDTEDIENNKNHMENKDETYDTESKNELEEEKVEDM